MADTLSVGDVSGMFGSLFGIAGSISQATTLQRSIERSSEEAAVAVAQARDNTSKIPELEKELPVIHESNTKRCGKNQEAITRCCKGFWSKSCIRGGSRS